jgi:KUP system potassium uptake protein
MSAPMNSTAARPSGPDARRTASLAAAAIGVVYGDIGTSPLYALQECFNPEHGVDVSPANVLGIASLVLWSILVVVTLKYVLFVRIGVLGGSVLLAVAGYAMLRTLPER